MKLREIVSVIKKPQNKTKTFTRILEAWPHCATWISVPAVDSRCRTDRGPCFVLYWDHLRDHTLQQADSTGARAYLDERKSSSWLQRLAFVLHLMSHVLLHPFFLIDLPLCHHVEEGARGDGDGDSKTGFRLLDDGKGIKQTLGL